MDKNVLGRTDRHTERDVDSETRRSCATMCLERERGRERERERQRERGGRGLARPEPGTTMA